MVNGSANLQEIHISQHLMESMFISIHIINIVFRCAASTNSVDADTQILYLVQCNWWNQVMYHQKFIASNIIYFRYFDFYGRGTFTLYQNDYYGTEVCSFFTCRSNCYYCAKIKRETYSVCNGPIASLNFMYTFLCHLDVDISDGSRNRNTTAVRIRIRTERYESASPI